MIAMSSSTRFRLALLLLFAGSIGCARAADEGEKSPIEPQLTKVTLAAGREEFKPTGIIEGRRERCERCTLLITPEGIMATANGKATVDNRAKPLWTVQGEPEKFLHVWAHSGDRAYIVSYPKDDDRAAGAEEVQKVRVLDLQTGKWLDYLNEESKGAIADVSANKERVAVLRQNAKQDGEGPALKSYDVTLFGKDLAKPLWTKNFSVTTERSSPGVFLWSARTPNFATSSIQHLSWLDDRLLVCAEAVQPVMCLEPDTGKSLWEIDRPWEFQRGFTGPSVWQHHIGRFGHGSFDDAVTDEERKAFDDRNQCAIVGGPIVVARRKADNGGSHSIFLAVSKGPTHHLGGYVADCLLYEFDADGKPVSMLNLPQMVRGRNFVLHNGGLVWQCQNESFLKLSATKLAEFEGIGPGGRDYLSHMTWFRQVSPPDLTGWFFTDKAGDPVAFGQKFAFTVPAGGYVADEGKMVFDFPLVAVDLANGQERELTLHVPFSGKLPIPQTNIGTTHDGDKKTYHTYGPYLLAVTQLHGEGDELEVTLGMEDWTRTLVFDVSKLAPAAGAK